MKTKIVLLSMVAVILLQTCNRAMIPYNAANHPHGKKCRDIK